MSNVNFSEIAKNFKMMDKEHLSLSEHNKRMESLSNAIDDIENNSSLAEDDKKEKQIDLLTKMNIELSYIMLGHIKNKNFQRYLCMILTIPIVIILAYNLQLSNLFSVLIYCVCIAVDIYTFIKITNDIEKIKNDFLNHNKEFFK